VDLRKKRTSEGLIYGHAIIMPSIYGRKSDKFYDNLSKATNTLQWWILPINCKNLNVLTSLTGLRFLVVNDGRSLLGRRTFFLAGGLSVQRIDPFRRVVETMSSSLSSVSDATLTSDSTCLEWWRLWCLWPWWWWLDDLDPFELFLTETRRKVKVKPTLRVQEGKIEETP